MAQTIVPTSDFTIDASFYRSSGTNPYYTYINTRLNTTYVRNDSPIGGLFSVRMGEGSINKPNQAGTYTLTYRCGKYSGNRQMDVTARLIDGQGTLLKTFSHTNVTSVTERTQILTTLDFPEGTNWSHMTFEIWAVMVGGGQPSNFELDWVDFVIPDYVPPVTIPLKINVGGGWKNINDLKINVGGVWKTVSSMKQAIGGVWKDVF